MGPGKTLVYTDYTVVVAIESVVTVEAGVILTGRAVGTTSHIAAIGVVLAVDAIDAE